jgi:hypothetical protein
MKRDGKWIRTMPSEDFSKWEEVECVKHSYRWSGNMPQTGEYCCVFCAKPEDENTYNGKADGE